MLFGTRGRGGVVVAEVGVHCVKFAQQVCDLGQFGGVRVVQDVQHVGERVGDGERRAQAGQQEPWPHK